MTLVQGKSVKQKSVKILLVNLNANNFRRAFVAPLCCAHGLVVGVSRLDFIRGRYSLDTSRLHEEVSGYNLHGFQDGRRDLRLEIALGSNVGDHVDAKVFAVLQLTSVGPLHRDERYRHRRLADFVCLVDDSEVRRLRSQVSVVGSTLVQFLKLVVEGFCVGTVFRFV